MAQTSPAKSTEPLAIIGLILSILLPPLGLILSILAFQRIKRNGSDGKTMAIIGIVVGAIPTVLFIILFLIAALFSKSNIPY
jgi:uncharacterized membrane protein YbaN (DUF454 family)